MSSTKDKIIEHSIKLFNQYGYNNVSLHQIAEALQVSSGNLTYHYPKKAALMEAVYNVFVNDLLGLQASIGVSSTIEDMLIELDEFIKIQNRYRFFYVDLLDIGRNYPAIAKQHYRHIQGQINRIEENLIFNCEAGIINQAYKTMLPQLAETIWMTVVFWPSQMILRGKKNNPDDLLSAVSNILKPYVSQEFSESLNKKFKTTAQL